MKIPFFAGRKDPFTNNNTLTMDKIQIGSNAGLLWKLLDADHDKRVWDLDSLQQASGLSEREFYAAIGWLAREDKVDFGEDGLTHNGTVGLVINYFH